MSVADANAEPNAESIAESIAVPIGNGYGFTNANAVPMAHNGLLSAGGYEQCSQYRQRWLYGAAEVQHL